MSILDVKPEQDFDIDSLETTTFTPQLVAHQLTHSIEVRESSINRLFESLRQWRTKRANRVVFEDHRVYEDYRDQESRRAWAQESVLRAWGQVRL